MLRMNLQYFGGRGSSSGGGGLPTLTPGSGSGNSNLPWDSTAGTIAPPTLKDALGKKGQGMSIERATMGANPYFSKDMSHREFNENCQRAVVAYELRRRGYNVIAQPTYEGDKLPQVTASGNGRWQGAFKNAKRESVSGKTAKQVEQNIEKKMSEYGNGSRAVVAIQYKDGSGGHVFNIERKGGKTMYVEAQAGGKYKPSAILAKAKPESVSIVRTDNLKVSDRAKKSVTPADAIKTNKFGKKSS